MYPQIHYVCEVFIFFCHIVVIIVSYNNNFYNPYNPYVPYRSFRNNSGYYGNDYYGGNGNYSRNPIELNVRLGLIGGVSSPSSLGMYTTIGGHKNFIYLLIIYYEYF